jgi:hypothetical protein
LKSQHQGNTKRQLVERFESKFNSCFNAMRNSSRSVLSS